MLCSLLDMWSVLQLMEHIADHLGADPVGVREINFLKAYPFDAPSPQPHPNGARPTATPGLAGTANSGTLISEFICVLTGFFRIEDL